MTQNTTNQPNPRSTYTTFTFRTTKGIFTVPNVLRMKIRAENRELSLYPVFIYRPATRANSGKQSMCGITSHEGTKHRCPTFCQHLDWKAEAGMQEGRGCSDEDFRIIHPEQYASCSSSPQEEEEIQTGSVPNI